MSKELSLLALSALTTVIPARYGEVILIMGICRMQISYPRIIVVNPPLHRISVLM